MRRDLRWTTLPALLLACASSPATSSDAGVDAPLAADVPVTPDAPAVDAPTADTPSPTDVPVVLDAPAPVDAMTRDVTPVDAAPAPTDGGPRDAGGDAATPHRARLEGLVAEVADALCGALYRCCDDASRGTFLAPLRASDRHASLRDRIPADGRLDRAACPALLADAWRIAPLGDWVQAALDGRVGFVPDAADACLAQLRTATCGAAVRAALNDSTCFAFAAPPGGTAQRRMFTRSATEGAACAGLADGVGGGFFGTCDPTRAFCCGAGPDGRCVAVGRGAGTCRAASAEGASCGITPELRVCATGLVCDAARCAVESTAPLAVGARCAMNFRLLGECVDSYCDLGGTDRCTAFVEPGAACTLPTVCRSGRCEMGRCAAETFCTGAP